MTVPLYLKPMVIVDGNNVMGQRVGWHRDKRGAQRRLREEVEHFARQENEPHLLVFDAAPAGTPDETGEETGTPLLTTLYARRGSSADELILERVYRHEGPELCVVTSDRSLARQARVLGARVISSGEFRRRLEQCAGAGNPDA